MNYNSYIYIAMHLNQKHTASFTGVSHDASHSVFGAFNIKDMKKEVWKDIPSYEGYYQVSNLGRVKSLSRKYSKAVRILKNSVATGYSNVALCKNANRKCVSVSLLVAMAFLGHKPNGYGVEVDHIDNNKSNNHLSNLQLITHRENCSKDKIGFSSKYIGVHWLSDNKKWRAEINTKGKRTHLGLFDNEIDAHNAYINELKNIK